MPPELQIRPATADDLKGVHPEADGVSYRAWAAELDGKTVGVIGLALTRPRACLFCAFEEELRPHLKAMPILRLLKKVKDTIEARGLPVYAIREPDEDKAPAILARLGFERFGEVDGDDVWMWEGTAD
jgi:hypothetical protein